MATKRCARDAAVREMTEDCEASLWDFLERETNGEVEGPPGCKGKGGCGSQKA
jgi:hypothetical protein